ncbi:MAG: DUF6036 family nucleotidyltransferase [Planctomycetota bacterium]
MNSTTVQQALELLGEHFRWPEPVEITLVGGAAGMLIGTLPPERTTSDCDVVRHLPEDAGFGLITAAATVAEIMGLDERWLNSDVTNVVPTMPDGWRDRRHRLGYFGEHLIVFAADRVDLIALKFLAGRDQDLDDLEALAVTGEDTETARHYLEQLAATDYDAEKLTAARELIDAWETKP